KQARIQKAIAVDQSVKDNVPLDFSSFIAELAARLPEDVIIFDEALTGSPAVARYLPPTKTGQYFLTRGGSLGVGIPGAIGAKLANPDKVVIGLTGDGGSMYTIQALWTAARHNVNAKFIICNNRSYKLLQLNIQAYWLEQGIESHDFPLSFDLSKPALHFAEMARSMGVEAERVETPEQIIPAIARALAHDGPYLLDVVVKGDIHPDAIGLKCGQ
ncbi:MAG: thiamine pyrophosphate-dependent enzyme, partial [Microcystaceae cyanobacterium]